MSSHRFSETGLDDDNNALLMKLQGVPWEERSCRYRCAIALADPQGILAQTMGSVEGIIQDELVGTNGFGYDLCFMQWNWVRPSEKHLMPRRMG